MRILIWDYWHHEVHGGRHVFVDNLVDALISRGHEVALVAMKAEIDPHCQILQHSTSLSSLMLSEPGVLFHKRIFEEIRKTLRFIEQFNPDVIHNQSIICPSKRLLDLIQGRTSRRIPEIMTVHDIIEANRVASITKFSHSVENLSYITVPSAYIYDRTFNDYSAKKIKLLPHGIAPQEPSSHDKQSQVVYNGRLIIEKGLIDLMKAWSLIYESLPETRLHIFGDGPLRSYLERLAVDLNISQRTMLHGAKSNFEVRGHLTSNSILVQPSLIPEAFGLSVLEAMSASAGIIVSDKANLPHLIRHGVDGLVYQARDTNTLAMNILDLANSKLLRETLGKSAQNRAFEEFSFERMIDLYENLYLQCLS